MNKPNITNLGELRASGYQSRSIKEELRENLIPLLKAGKHPFHGIYGYEDSVLPAVERGILAAHDILLLGLRGQAKTRIARQMIELLDPWMPVIKDSELNEDPMAPITRECQEIVAIQGDATEIDWVSRDDRFFEKLATPDTTVADLIGDIDPIKAANEKLSFSDDRVIHYGMIPRAHRSIFVINELPDLQPRLQVSLFNILQEGDIQIRGFQKRLQLDLQFVFTANPEDYTNRGSIVTPLKDRIGSQIHTHYPKSLDTALKITAQETERIAGLYPNIEVSELAKEIIEQLAFSARESSFIDAGSGVSARMTISAYEALLTTAERRRLIEGASSTSVRLSDFYGTISAIVGKVELVYEGEQEGAQNVAQNLLGQAVKAAYERYFPKFRNLKRTNENNPFIALQEWFGRGGKIELFDEFSVGEYQRALDVPVLNDFVTNHWSNEIEATYEFLKEMVLWALAEYSQVNKERTNIKTDFNDLFGNMISGLGDQE
jgi:magnesium chelatase subunit I